MVEKLNIRIKPEPESEPVELFSSWDARVGLAHGVSLNEIIRYINLGGDFDKKDIDKYCDEDVVNIMAVATQTDIAKAKKTSLYLRVLPISTIEKNVYTAEWLTHVNNIYTTKRTFGLSFCPLCLTEDKIPFIRVDWRLSFVNLCLKHNCLLHDKCPFCKQEVNLYRIPGYAETIAVCCWCGKDIRQAPTLRSSCFARYSKVQAYLISLLDRTQTCSESERSKIGEYFRSLYYFTFMVSQQCVNVNGRCMTFYEELLGMADDLQPHLYYDAHRIPVRLIMLDLSFSLFEKAFQCNFKLHSNRYASENKKIKLTKQIPCGKWCEKNDYLGISRSCEKLIKIASE